jgi:hypothetical protein
MNLLGSTKWRVVAAALALVLIAAVAAFARRSPGTGEWDQTARVWRGVYVHRPYPMLRVEDQGAIVPALLVREGKCGMNPSDEAKGLAKYGAFCGPPPGVSSLVEMSERLAELDGKLVEVDATTLRREGRLAIEVLSMPRLVEGNEETRKAAAKLREPQAESSEIARGESRLLYGEIVDSKCYLGAMKPGEGANHRSCAVRCVEGGIPPMLVTHDRRGNATCYLILTHDGKAANQQVIGFIGDYVDVAGRVEERGGWLYLALHPEEIRRR